MVEKNIIVILLYCMITVMKNIKNYHELTMKIKKLKKDKEKMNNNI